MKFQYYNLETCDRAHGLVIVIDVIRAFTNAAFIFARGARAIYPVSTVKKALEFKREHPSSLASGEVGGLPPANFDFGNSPTEVLTLDLRGRSIVQRTGAGTQGVARSCNAEVILASSIVVAAATERYVRRLNAPQVTFVISGQLGENSGDEDLACAEYLERSLRGESPDPAPYLQRVRESSDAKLFYDSARPEFPASDIERCTELDRFDFAMPVTNEAGRLVMRRT